MAEVHSGGYDGTRNLSLYTTRLHSSEPSVNALQRRSLPSCEVCEVVNRTVTAGVFALLDVALLNVSFGLVRLHLREVLVQNGVIVGILVDGVELHLHLVAACPVGCISVRSDVRRLKNCGLANGEHLYFLGRL